MASLWKNASNQLLKCSGTNTIAYTDACPCGCCTECTLASTLTATAPAGPENAICSLQGATLADRTITCDDTVYGGDWPVPAGTNYYIGDCPSDITSYQFVTWCEDGNPRAIVWNPATEVIEMEYELLSCSADPLEWEFFEADPFIPCADCARYVIVTE